MHGLGFQNTPLLRTGRQVDRETGLGRRDLLRLTNYTGKQIAVLLF